MPKIPHPPPQPSQLRSLIGRTTVHHGDRWLVIDYQPDGPSLVLENTRKHAIQADQYGNGRRRAPLIEAVPVVGRNGELHPAIAQLL